MKIRLFLSIVFFVVLFFTTNLTEQYFMPRSSQDLAIQQIKEDGSREILRMQENYQNYFDIIFYVILIFVFVIIWGNYIKNIFNNVKKEESYSKKL